MQILNLESARPRTTRPDIGILHPLVMPATSSQTATPTSKALILPSDEVLLAIDIYEASQLVTRVELILPTNKQSVERSLYFNMRSTRLSLKVNMVEIDFLHEIPHLIPELLPPYPEESSYAYHISVWQPEIGRARAYGFGVNQEIPTIPIPLRGEDWIELNLNEPYQLTAKKDPRASRFVDYEQVPIGFETYSAADQAQICAVMNSLQSEN